MQLKEILFSQILRAGKIRPPEGGVHISDAVNFMRQRYMFVTAPKSLEEFDFNRGVEFGHGKFTLREKQSKKSSKEKSYVIGGFQFFSSGLVVNSTASTEVLDEFLDDLIEWAVPQFGFTQPAMSIGPSQYTSQIEVQLDFRFPQNPFEEMVGKAVQSMMAKNQPDAPQYEKSGVSWQFDPPPNAQVAGRQFLIQWREGASKSSGLFYSQAPLSTPDHLKLLEKIETFRPA